MNNEEYLTNQTYNATLQIPEDAEEQMDNNSLGIELEWNTSVGQVSYMTGGPKYRVFREKKTWGDAEATCQHEGGHLASVQSENENTLLDDGSLWLGGKDEEDGVWKWSDGTKWKFTAWDLDYDSNGDDGYEEGTHCLAMRYGVWQ